MSTKSQWARKRQMMYAAGVVVVVILIVAPIAFFTIHEEPTCFDGEQNQGETAPDKGGPCAVLDERSVQPHAVLWSRAFSVREGFYNAVAYIENPNPDAGVYSAAYEFKLYDERNILVAERSGRVPILPGKVFPIFETQISTGNRIPTRTFFSFTSDFTWERMDDPTAGLTVSNERLSGLSERPRLDARVTNTNVTAKEDIVIIATLFGRQGNAVGSSRTILDRLEADETRTIAFTWPEPFETPVTRVDIVLLAVPQRTQ